MMLAKWTPTREMAAVHNHLANILFDADFRAVGRNLEQLGLANLSAQEIRNL